MSDKVEVLAPTNPGKAEKAIRGLGGTHVVQIPSEACDEQVLVAWLTDLNVARRRRELGQLIDVLAKRKDPVPLVLVAGAPTKAKSYEIFETLTRWSCLSSFYLAPDVDAVRRVIRARLAGAESKLIASVLIEDEKLIVWSCEPRRYIVPASEIPALAGLSSKELKTFTLNEAGSRLHWDARDIDLNLDAIRYYADPQARKSQDRARREEASHYSQAIRLLREQHGLKQAEIEGLTERQVRRLEQGENIPRAGTLQKLAAAHGMSLSQYLQELAKCSKASDKAA